jgi:hypothetical protein
MDRSVFKNAAAAACLGLLFSSTVLAQAYDAKTCFSQGQERDRTGARLTASLDVSNKEMSALTNAKVFVHVKERIVADAKKKGDADVSRQEAELKKAKAEYDALEAKPPSYDRSKLMRELDELLASKKKYREDCVGKFDESALSSVCPAGIAEPDAGLCDWLKKK